MKKQGLISGFALAAAMALSPYAISAAPGAGPAIGDKVRNGTVYAGISPDTHEPFYTTPADASGTYTMKTAFFSKQNDKEWNSSGTLTLVDAVGSRFKANYIGDVIDGMPGIRSEDGSVNRPPNASSYQIVGEVGDNALRVIDPPSTRFTPG